MFAKVTVALCAAALTGGTAIAATPVLSSGAYGANLKVNAGVVPGTVVANATLLAALGSTPGHYDVTPALGSIDQTFQLAGNAIIGTNEALSGRVTALEASTTYPTGLAATGTVTIADGGATLTSYALTGVLASLGFGFDTIGSTTTVSGDSGSLVGTSQSQIAGLRFGSSALLDTAALNTALAGTAAAGANSMFTLLPGLTLTLNEQIATAVGTSALTQQTNALHLAFTNFGFGGSTFNGNLILGHSEASISGFTPATAPVPEPASWAMMVAGFGAMGAMLRRGKRAAALPA